MPSCDCLQSCWLADARLTGSCALFFLVQMPTRPHSAPRRMASASYHIQAISRPLRAGMSSSRSEDRGAIHPIDFRQAARRRACASSTCCAKSVSVGSRSSRSTCAATPTASPSWRTLTRDQRPCACCTTTRSLTLRSRLRPYRATRRIDATKRSAPSWLAFRRTPTAHSSPLRRVLP